MSFLNHAEKLNREPPNHAFGVASREFIPLKAGPLNHARFLIDLARRIRIS